MNTFGNYAFEDWIPKKEQQAIIDFWGWAGRTHKDWLNIPDCYAKELPKTGDLVKFTRGNPYKDEQNEVIGRFLHMWNNIGRVIDENGQSHMVSSCDKWEFLLG